MSYDYIEKANALIQKTMNLSNEDISNEALEFIKSNKNMIVNKYLILGDASKKAYFMAGGAGAGKSEIAKIISETKNIDVIEADEIRRICPYYSGKNSSLFQKASSKAVSVLIDMAFKKQYSFILDGNFSEERLQEENISRASIKNYDIEIYFVYRPLSLAKEFTEIREEKEGRNMPENTFYEKFLGSIKTVNEIKKKYPNVKLNYYDLAKNIIKEDISNLEEIINSDFGFKEDMQIAENFISCQLKDLARSEDYLNKFVENYEQLSESVPTKEETEEALKEFLKVKNPNQRLK
jgi:UDP-N-acetylglucosamine kinase